MDSVWVVLVLVILVYLIAPLYTYQHSFVPEESSLCWFGCSPVLWSPVSRPAVARQRWSKGYWDSGTSMHIAYRLHAFTSKSLQGSHNKLPGTFVWLSNMGEKSSLTALRIGVCISLADMLLCSSFSAPSSKRFSSASILFLSLQRVSIWFVYHDDIYPCFTPGIDILCVETILVSILVI